MISIGRASKTYPQFASAPTIESPHAYPKPFLFTRIPYDFRARATDKGPEDRHKTTEASSPALSGWEHPNPMSPAKRGLHKELRTSSDIARALPASQQIPVFGFQ